MNEQRVERILDRLGLDARPEPDLAGLTLLYEQWSYRVPFDNVQKRLYFAEGRGGPLPGATPESFFDDWLQDGTGGTCWAASGALFALLDHLGFAPRRVLGTMMPHPEVRGPNHGSVAAFLEGCTYLVDVAMLSRRPIPLGGAPLAAGTVGIDRTEERDGTWRVHWFPLHKLDGMPCRIDDVDAGAERFAEQHERTRHWSPFNYALSARRLRGDDVIGVGIGRRAILRADGSSETGALEGSERVRFLVEELGVSERVASRLPADEPTPPPPGAP